MTNSQNHKKILIDIIEKKIIDNKIKIDKGGSLNFFNDEPHFPSFFLNASKVNYQNKINIININSFGFSFRSKSEALLKCLGEFIERFCLFYKLSERKAIRINSLNIKRYKTIDLSPYEIKINKENLGWVEGIDLNENKRILIPAQLIFLDFAKIFNEKLITEPISTGTAGAFSLKESLIKGIYELIERDCFMTMYLLKIPPKKLILNNFLKNKYKLIFEKISKFRLSFLSFDITNDLEIPTYLSFIFDKFNIPYFTLGMKSNLNEIEAFVGSLEEALMSRLIIKNEIINKQKKFSEKNSIEKCNIKVETFEDRINYWLKNNSLEKLNFIFRTKNIKKIKIKRVKISLEDELEELKKVFKKRGLKIYYFKIMDKRYFVTKLICPSLQPLYLNERLKKIRLNRILSVAKYFNKKRLIFNTYPHPFL